MAESTLTEADFAAIDAAVSERIEAAMDAARKAPLPEPADLYTDVYEVYD